MHIFFDERLLGSLILHVVILLQKFIILSPRNKGNFLEFATCGSPSFSNTSAFKQKCREYFHPLQTFTNTAESGSLYSRFLLLQ